jgi:hypothetical protein
MDRTPQTLANIQTLLKEYERASVDIRAIETMNDKVIGFGLTIIGTGFTFGIQHSILPVFFFLPFAFIAVFFYATLQYYNMFWLGGYKRALEERINFLSSYNVLCWEALVETRKERVNIINASLVSIYFSLLLAATAYSFFEVFSKAPLIAGCLYLAAVLFLGILLAFSILQMFGAFARSYAASRELLDMPIVTIETQIPGVPDARIASSHPA